MLFMLNNMSCIFLHVIRVKQERVETKQSLSILPLD